jgi:heat shock protein HtpX
MFIAALCGGAAWTADVNIRPRRGVWGNRVSPSLSGRGPEARAPRPRPLGGFGRAQPSQEHELAHIKHRDTLVSSIAATIAGAITMLADMAMWGMMFAGLTGQGDDDDGGGIAEMVGGILMMILAPIAAVIIQMAISRSREYLADAGGARILGDPLPLASALEKLEWAAGRLPMQTSPATSHLYIVNPLVGGLAGLFRTHPDTGERIARLRSMATRSPMMAA